MSQSNKTDCLSCRIIGGGAFVYIGSYALWSSRPKAVGSPFGKKVVGAMGAGRLSLCYLLEDIMTELYSPSHIRG
jgi:hypothetical protein